MPLARPSSPPRPSLAGFFSLLATAADPPTSRPQDEATARLVLHEWGTFTSFSGSDGVPVGFRPDNTNLPEFVYCQVAEPGLKANRLSAGGTVSMETPVIYFYTKDTTRVSVRVDFPRGWITEWYPFAASPPAHSGPNPRVQGQSMRWDVRLIPGESVRLPREGSDNHYYRARETDATPVQADVATTAQEPDRSLRGGTLVQREKFLFYRGVGTFPPPVGVCAVGGGRVRIKNPSSQRVGGLVLITVREGKLGFRTVPPLDSGAEVLAELPEANTSSEALVDILIRELTTAGLYDKEARAMVRTWGTAWFGETGTRLLYLVPRSRTDELLHLTVSPEPAEVARVLVGRHDFLTPEQEVEADRQVSRARAAQAEIDAADRELLKIGRFAPQARQMAAKRLETLATPR